MDTYSLRTTRVALYIVMHILLYLEIRYTDTVYESCRPTWTRVSRFRWADEQNSFRETKIHRAMDAVESGALSFSQFRFLARAWPWWIQARLGVLTSRTSS